MRASTSAGQHTGHSARARVPSSTDAAPSHSNLEAGLDVIPAQHGSERSVCLRLALPLEGVAGRAKHLGPVLGKGGAALAQGVQGVQSTQERPILEKSGHVIDLAAEAGGRFRAGEARVGCDELRDEFAVPRGTPRHELVDLCVE